MKQHIFNKKYILESDADQPQSTPASVPQPQEPGSPVLNKIITGASVGIGGVAACLAYLYKTYGITNWEGLSTWFKNAITQSNTDGWFATFIKRILGSVGAALTWASNLVKPLTANVPYLSSPIAGSTFTYGSVLAMAIIAAAVGAVIYKVYKVIKNRKKPQETTEAFFVRQRFEMMTALNECDMMFNELTVLTESNAVVSKHTTLSEWSIPDWLSNLFVSYKNVGGEAITKAASGNTTELSKAFTSGDGFIGKIQGSIQSLYEQVTKIASNMPMLAKVVIVITALVACWFGVKKYLANKAKNDEKKQALNNQNNNSAQNANVPKNTNTTQNINNQRNNNNTTVNKVNNTNAAPATA